MLPSSGRTLQHKRSLQRFNLPAGVKPSLPLVLYRLVLYSCNHLKIIFNKHEEKTYCFQATGPVPLRAGHLKQPHLFQGSKFRLTCCPTHAPASALFLPFSRCCQTHDNCYKQAKKLDSCKVLVDNPYTNNYSYSCSNNEITCSSENNACEAFICNCDRNAAICFSKVPYNKEHKNLDKKKC
uniref:Phospholipase A2 n=1 Tax=Bos indicus x Bos taurus TaxID=30522 RepID=A0A4W2H4Z5_BOBOX